MLNIWDATLALPRHRGNQANFHRWSLKWQESYVMLFKWTFLNALSVLLRALRGFRCDNEGRPWVTMDRATQMKFCSTAVTATLLSLKQAEDLLRIKVNSLFAYPPFPCKDIMMCFQRKKKKKTPSGNNLLCKEEEQQLLLRMLHLSIMHYLNRKRECRHWHFVLKQLTYLRNL